jgi:hypothetical protein
MATISSTDAASKAHGVRYEHNLWQAFFLYLVEIQSDVVRPPVGRSRIACPQHGEQPLGVFQTRIDGVGVGGEVVLYNQRPAHVRHRWRLIPLRTRAVAHPTITICNILSDQSLQLHTI